MSGKSLGTGIRCPVFVKRRAGPLLVLVLLLVLAAMMIPVHVLEVRTVRENRVLMVRRVVPGDTFSLGFIHSVEKSPVRDFYGVDAWWRLVQRETEFSSCNTGLPVTLQGREKLINDGARFRVTGMERVLPEILLWVHETSGNMLVFKDGSALKLARPGDSPKLLRVAVMPITAGQFIIETITAGDNTPS